jgi:hypothetical protein
MRFVQRSSSMEQTVANSASGTVPPPQAPASLSELADHMKTGVKKTATKNGESCVAIIGAQRLDHSIS